MTSGVSSGTTSTAFIFSCTCDTRLAPVMTELTNGFFKHHASDNCATVQSNSFAMDSNTFTFARLFLSVTAAVNQSIFVVPARLFCGMPPLYFPVNNPEASGLNVVAPYPYSL